MTEAGIAADKAGVASALILTFILAMAVLSAALIWG